MPLGEFDAPVTTAAPADDARLFVVQRAGLIRVLGADNTLRADPFLDVTRETTTDGERGLLGLAFAPDYATSRQFFVYMTAADGEVQVRRYTTRADDPNRADPASGTVLLRQPHAEFGNHDGGTVRVGPDGKLWAAIGDGGGSNNSVRVDGQYSAQSLQTLLGKVVRINLDGTVPLDNPYVGTMGARPEIWSSGLRNPYRFSFDRQTGDLVLGDVGQDAVEEVDWARDATGLGKGANYGWPCFEGSRTNTVAEPCSAPNAVGPALEYTHQADGGVSITGGVVVRDPGLPSLTGRYLFTDLAFPALRSASLGSAGLRTESDLTTQPGVVGIDEDGCGRVVVTAINGTVWRVADGTPTPCGTSPGSTPTTTGPDAPVAGVQPGCPSATARAPKRLAFSVLRRRGVPVTVSSRSECTVVVRARGARSVQTTLVPGATRRLRVRPRPAARRAIARRLARGRTVRLTVRVAVRLDAGGRTRVRRLVVRISG